MDVITADIGRSLVPDSLQVPKDSDSDDDDNGDVDDVVVQEIGSDIDDRGDFDEVYDKIEDEGEAVVEEGEDKREQEEKREEESITTLLPTTRSGRICRTWQALWIFHDGAGNFKVSITNSHQMVKEMPLQK